MYYNYFRDGLRALLLSAFLIVMGGCAGQRQAQYAQEIGSPCEPPRIRVCERRFRTQAAECRCAAERDVPTISIPATTTLGR